MPTDKPNILIFMTDHQRADTVLPRHPCLTPNMDEFARQGVTFTHAFCPTPHCCPARATFFSGLYPTRSGVWNNICNDMALSRGLLPGVRLFSEDLAEAGYNLAYSGKWHVSVEETPKDRGWEELYVTATAAEHHGTRWEALRNLATQPDPSERKPGQILRPGYGTDLLYGPTQSHGHDETAIERALQGLPRLADAGQPWAMFVGLVQPHAPYMALQRYLDLYDIDAIPLPPSYADTLEDKPGYYRKLRRQHFDQLGEAEIRDAIRHFWAVCSYIDELFGRVLAALDATGQADDTLVVFCSDHGDYLGEHGLFHKGVPAFRGAYEVPAVVRWPVGIVDPGRQVDALVSLADFAPTFTQLSGQRVDETLTGKSLVPFLQAENPAGWRDAMHAQVNGVEHYFTQRAVWTHDHKYVYNGFDDDELYDLRVDPEEMHNRQADPAYAEVRRDLVRRMWRFAYEEQDPLGPDGGYVTVGMAPWGPAEAFR